MFPRYAEGVESRIFFTRSAHEIVSTSTVLTVALPLAWMYRVCSSGPWDTVC